MGKCGRNPGYCRKAGCDCYTCEGCGDVDSIFSLSLCPWCHEALCWACWDGGVDSHDCYSIWVGAKIPQPKPESPTTISTESK